jgi:aspartate aminotransferase
MFANRISTMGTEDALKVYPHILKMQDEGKDVIRLNLSEPDFNIPSWIKEEIKKQVEDNNTFYCDPQGVKSFRDVIAKQMGDSRGLRISPEQVVVFPGSKPIIGFSQQVYCNPMDEVIYPSPGYSIYESFTKYVGAVPKPLFLKEEEGFALNPKRLEEIISPRTRLIFLNFPSNPTGVVPTRDELEAISEVILKKCPPYIRVFSDEIYESIVFDGKPHLSIASIPGMEKKTIIVGSVSKTFSWSGGRVGYAVFPTKEEALIFKDMNLNYFSCVPPYNQEGARYAMENPLSQMHIKEKQQTFQKRRDEALEKLKENPLLSCHTPDGAFYLFPNVSKVCEKLGIFDVYKQLTGEEREVLSPSTIFQLFLLFNYQVAVIDRSSFGKVGGEDEHFIRLSLAAESSEILEGLKRLHQASYDVEGFQKFITESRDILTNYLS